MLVYLGISLWAALLGARVYRYDLYHKAPRAMLLVALAAGFGVMWLLSDWEDRTWDAWCSALNHGAGRALVAATHEEFAKLAIVAALALACRRSFRDPMDGLVYGAFAGLGMAIQESIFYLSLRTHPGVEALGVEAVRLLLHTLLGGLSAFAVGMAAARIKGWPLALAGWWLTAAGLHFLWDFCVAWPVEGLAWSDAAIRLTAATLAMATVGLFGASVLLASRWSRAIFAPDSPSQLWGWPFVRTDRPATPRRAMSGVTLPSLTPASSRRVAA